jgi:uncharacterized protein GlcG (DUF336 family)
MSIDLTRLGNLFRQEANRHSKTIWMTVVDEGNEVLACETVAKGNKVLNLKLISSKMARTANNLRLPSGFEIVNGELKRITISPKSNFPLHETTAIGGLPIMSFASQCFGGLGIAGLSNSENAQIANMLIKESGFYIDPLWTITFKPADLICT